MSHPNRIAIDWEQIKADSLVLAKKIKSGGVVPSRILAVTRGGLVPAALVARALRITKIETIGLASYEGEQQSGVITELKKADSGFLRDTLVIDDLVDTGMTFEYLRPRTQECLFATLYAKPAGAPQADHYVTLYDQDCWIDFPWEV